MSKPSTTARRFVVALVFLCSVPAWGDDEKAAALDEIVVTATRVESSIGEVDRSISLIRKD